MANSLQKRPAFSGVMQSSSDLNVFLENKATLSKIENNLISNIKPETFIATLAVLWDANDQLKKADKKTLLLAALQAANLGLSIHPNTAEAYLIPYGQSVQLQLSYKAVVKLISRSSQISHIEARSVHFNDFFEFSYGLEPKIEHKPSMELITPDTFKCVYAVATLSDGKKVFEVLGKEKIEQLRLKNMMQKNGIKGAWLTDYPEMAKAKAVKYLGKLMPLEIEIRNTLNFDENKFTGNSQVYTQEQVNNSTATYEYEEAEIQETTDGKIDTSNLPDAKDLGIEV